jgi:hypothetical protein
MANIRKSFNFRNGVQVDEDNLIVNSVGLVGIGTSVPTESLDVRGTARVVGLMTATQINSPSAVISGVATIGILSAANISLNSGIITSTNISGLVTYYGDGGKLLNLPTSQWVDVDSGFGYTSIYAAGNVGINTNYPYSSFQVGGNPINQKGVGINSGGDINATGIVTAYEFVGFGTNIEGLDGANITTGTISANRLPTIDSSVLAQSISVSGIITAQGGFSGNLTGNINSSGVSTIANLQNTQINSGIITAQNKFSGLLEGTVVGSLNSSGVSTIANLQNTQINSGIITAQNKFSGLLEGNVISSGVSTFFEINSTQITNTGFITASYFSGGLIGISSFARDLTSNANIDIYNVVTDTLTSGIATISSRLRVSGNIGINTDSPQSNIHIFSNSGSRLQITGTESTVIVGSALTPTSNSGGIKFGNTAGIYPYSTIKSLDIFNYDLGNLNYYLNYGVGNLGTGSFNWIDGQDASTTLMTLTYDGNLGIGDTNPTKKLQVVGDAEIVGNIDVDTLNVTGDITSIGAGTSSSVETLYVYGGLPAILGQDGGQLIIPQTNQNLDITSGVSTFFTAFFGDKIAIGNTNPRELLHIGSQSFSLTPEDPNDAIDALVMNGTGIGIGRTDIRFDLGIDCLQFGAIFESVGIGTTNAENPPGNKFYVNGPSIVNGNTRVSGILTSTNGFTSGIGTAVQISTIGNQLIFTVPGVGTTSLTLF